MIKEVVFEQMAEFLEDARAPIRLLDTNGCAQWLGVTPRTLSKLRTMGMPHLFVGDSPRFEAAAVLEWLKVNANRSDMPQRE